MLLCLYGTPLLLNKSITQDSWNSPQFEEETIHFIPLGIVSHHFEITTSVAAVID